MEISEKNYSVMENIIQKINQKYVALSETEKKRNNHILNQVVEKIITTMKEKNPLFKNLYQTKYYGGSYYDNLRVSEPTEYDLDVLFALPKIIDATVVPSDMPGYVHVITKSFKQLEKQKEMLMKFSSLSDFLDGDQFSTKKVLKWMDSILNLALNEFRENLGGNKTKFNSKVLEMLNENPPAEKAKKNLKSPATIKVKTESQKYIITASLSKSGPAHTLKLECVSEDSSEQFSIDVDLVPSFTFNEDQWPKSDYRENPSSGQFFVVPKSPNSGAEYYWRLSFQKQEKELLSGDLKQLKPCIRLLKKLRDRYNHKISSYAIKTVLLWELEKMDKTMFNKPLSFVFMTILQKYTEYVSEGNIPYFWNKKFNLISDLKESTCIDIANCLRNIKTEVTKNLITDPFKFATFLLTAEEVEMLKSEVNLGKKYLKQQQALTIAGNESISDVKTIELVVKSDVATQTSNPASANSSFEDLSEEVTETFDVKVDTILQKHDKMDRVFNVLLEKLTKMESLCINLVSENKRLLQLHESATEKIESLQEDEKNRASQKSQDDFKISLISDKIDLLEKKIDRILDDQNKSGATDEFAVLLDNAADKLKLTANYQLS